MKSAAYCDGWMAHKKGAISEQNPYNAVSQPFSSGEWLSGWCDRFSAVKHDTWDFEDKTLIDIEYYR